MLSQQYLVASPEPEKTRPKTPNSRLTTQNSGLSTQNPEYMQIKSLFKYILLFLTLNSFGQSFPAKPDRLVNDYTNTLSAAEVNALEQKLVAFDDSTSTQIAVVLIPTLDGYDISDYGARLAESWGIGSAENDNGVLLLVALGDRKMTIQTGYGVEGALPDAIAKRIIEREIKPNFKAANYYQGIEAGTDAIISYTKGEYKAEQRPQQTGKSGSSFFVIIIIIVVLLLLSRRGGGGRGGQVIGGRGAASPFWWMLMGSGMGGGRSSGGGWGGGFGGGGFGGGGGGFGGFGGGGFGGGGASGSW